MRVAVPGFEATDYAWLHGRLVWLGDAAGSAHPRNARQPWQPPALRIAGSRLRAGAVTALSLISSLPAKGLLVWLLGQPLPFPVTSAAARFDAVRAALHHNDPHQFLASALKVLGLGSGLTPSGDDFVGGVLFALKHLPRRAWRTAMPGLLRGIHEAAASATNPISAALLDDLMAGASHAELHAVLATLQDNDAPHILSALQVLLRVGASSGADMLCGLLLALTTTPDADLEA